jgi:hypothetical protein
MIMTTEMKIHQQEQQQQQKIDENIPLKGGRTSFSFFAFLVVQTPLSCEFFHHFPPFVKYVEQQAKSSAG